MDIVQNAVCKALDHYEAIRNENAVRTWFYRILVNESLLLIRKQKMEIPAEDGIGQEIPCIMRKDTTGKKMCMSS